MDVTQQVNRQMIGSGSGSSRPEYYAVNRSLNYAQGANNITTAKPDVITAGPARRNYKDAVGLFGAENVFIKYELDITNSLLIDGNGILQNDYLEMSLDTSIDDSDLYYATALIDWNADLEPIVNDYEPAVLDNSLQVIPNAVASVSLQNLKTGNKYIDTWFDVRLYNSNREEHPYDFMYCPLGSSFYVGFHARNTKRLPYNVSVTVAERIVDSDTLRPDERRFLVK